MKRIFFLLAFMFVLSGCGSHGYEGKYKGILDLIFIKQTMIVEIADDYVSIRNGNDYRRAEIEGAKVIKKNGEKYLLITEKGGAEVYFKIIDDDTLSIYFDTVQVILDRIKE